MSISAAVRRLRTDLTRLHKAERELAGDKKDMKADRREVTRDSKELAKDRKAGDRAHKVGDRDLKALNKDVSARDSALNTLEAQRQDVLNRYQDAFDPGSGLALPNPFRDAALQQIDAKEAAVHQKFDARIDNEQAKVTADRASIADLRSQIKDDRDALRQDKKALTGDRKEIGRDQRAVKSARRQALNHLRPAEYKMSLKATNRVRVDLGLRRVSEAIRPVSEKVKRMLDIARANLGYREGAGNSNKFSSAMGRPAEAWCADFVSYLAKRAGLNTVNTASAQGIADQLEAKGRWKGRNNPQPGDAVTFNWSGNGGWADHVGIVEKVFKRGGRTYIQTIEGNSSDGVNRRTYPANASVINGFGRIA